MQILPCRPKWKGTMADRQRFINQMHHKPVDRCFNMEFGYWTSEKRGMGILPMSGTAVSAVHKLLSAKEQEQPAIGGLRRMGEMPMPH